MEPLQKRLATVLADGGGISVETEADGALTVFYDGTWTSLRVVAVTEDLDLVLLTQVLVRDLPLTRQVRELLTAQARDLNFGSVTVFDGSAPKTGDVILRYYFPGGGLADAALRTLILLVLDTGAEIRRALTA